jgi:hypothetical protein
MVIIKGVSVGRADMQGQAGIGKATSQGRGHGWIQWIFRRENFWYHPGSLMVTVHGAETLTGFHILFYFISRDGLRT